VTASYSDDQTVTFTVNTTGDATDAIGRTVSGSVSFTVVSSAPVPMAVTLSDDHQDVYVAGPTGPGSAVFTTTAPSS
jgi:hypothetical protein